MADDPSLGIRERYIPPYPASPTWASALRWCVIVMDDDDRDIGFAASLLSQAVKGGLSDKQKRYANKTISRVLELWGRGLLDCQQEADDEPDEALATALSVQTPRGTA